MKRESRFALCAAIFCATAACSPDDLQLASADVDGISWRGSYETLNGCRDGEIELHISERSPGWFEGRYHYSSSGGSFADYLVEGELLEDGQLALDQVEADEGPLPEGWRWCYGTLLLSFDPLNGGIAGDWEASDCSCNGLITLSDG